jgi:transposase
MTGAIPIAFPGFEIDRVEVTNEGVQIEAHAVREEARCPDCGQLSQRLHSWYQRHPMDLPCIGQIVRCLLNVRRFECPNDDCQRQTFVEPLGPWLLRYARRTLRVDELLALLGITVGGEVGEQLAQAASVPISARTFLRLVRRQAEVISPTPRVLGVDDWAMRKGQRYGTLLVDLETHRVVDLLPDREADSLAAWLTTHPGVEVICRDRASAYKEGATRGAPDAIQIADRWHLLDNARETVQEVLSLHRQHLTILDTHPVAPTSNAPPTLKKKAWAYNREERYARYQQMVALAEQGLDNQTIARAVGVSSTTVRAYLKADQFPEWQPRPTLSKWLLPYQPYLDQRWGEGQHNATQLWREIAQQGYTRSRALVLDYVAALRRGLPTPPAPVTTPPFKILRRYSPREASWLFVIPLDTLTVDQKLDLQHIRQACSDADLTYQFAQSFGVLVRERQPLALQPWMHAALESAIPAWRTFVFGLHRDLAAVIAALTLPWSNGQTEGQVNRLKLIKRQMYGRANLDLLRLRVLFKFKR